MRLHELYDEEILEGPRWDAFKKQAAGAALGAGLVGATVAGLGNNAPETPPEAPAITQPAPTQAAAPTAPQEKQLPTRSTSMSADPAKMTRLKQAAEKAGIKGDELAAFLAQVAHETLSFTSSVEQGNKRYFDQYDIRHNPTKAELLGNLHVGDGYRYRGRGYIHITGRDNYRKAGEALGLPLEKNPDMAAVPEIAAKIAIWFWKTRVQPNVTDWHDVRSVTRKINPAMQGLDDRAVNFKDIKQRLAQKQI
jgi:predicted chitinase